jgi:hypothetical protein
MKLGVNNRYYTTSMVEQHNHGLVSPDKIPLLESFNQPKNQNCLIHMAQGKYRYVASSLTLTNK